MTSAYQHSESGETRFHAVRKRKIAFLIVQRF